MDRFKLSRFLKDQNAAIGPMYAVGIFMLVGMSAVGFDYGRLMTLDSELQNAADQAALAAATQLDGSDDAMVNARNAATTTFATASSQFVNQTRLANDGLGRAITDLTFTFYDDYANDQLGDVVEDDVDGADARVVEVTVNARKVFYALTPLIGAFNSGDVIGKALAGIQTGTCNVPPLMFCVPAGLNGLADRSFPTAADIGKGLKLHMNANEADPWAPGNFGFLDIDYGVSGTPNNRLGLNSSGAGCIGDAVESDTGVRDPEATALNTRLDIYPNGANMSCDAGTGDFCPAMNVRRDYVRIEQHNNVTAAEVPGLACDAGASGNWELIENLPLATRPPLQGLPEDTCFGGGSCTVLGDAVWNGAAYMTLHHPGISLATAAPGGTRFEVYNWEMTNAATNLASKKVGYTATEKGGGGGGGKGGGGKGGGGGGGTTQYDVDLYCSYPQPMNGTGVPASDTQKDRRVLTVAAVDCTGLNGSQEVKVLRWVDLFLVKPASQNGSEKEFFTEIIGPGSPPDGSSGFQAFGRKKAVLIR